MARANGFVGEADHYAEQAARLEAESARDEEAERIAQRLHERLTPNERVRGGKVPAWFVPAIRELLDILAADGRLLPEGGTVLTAEQVAEARELLDAVDLDAEEFHLLRSAFTPPAAAVPDSGICGESGPGGGLCVEPLGHAGRHFTPTEPAPDSGPDGTPEKPWPTWQDVPEGVEYKDIEGDRYVNREGLRRKVFGPGRSTRNCALDGDWLNEHCAPFVRVDGDKKEANA
ncbi:hypothetical protein B0F74_04920 [Rhodococcus hoagii]|nr:hypothetical protein [Prescottella equi]